MNDKPTRMSFGKKAAILMLGATLLVACEKADKAEAQTKATAAAKAQAETPEARFKRETDAAVAAANAKAEALLTVIRKNPSLSDYLTTTSAEIRAQRYARAKESLSKSAKEIESLKVPASPTSLGLEMGTPRLLFYTSGLHEFQKAIETEQEAVIFLTKPAASAKAVKEKLDDLRERARSSLGMERTTMPPGTILAIEQKILDTIRNVEPSNVASAYTELKFVSEDLHRIATTNMIGSTTVKSAAETLWVTTRPYVEELRLIAESADPAARKATWDEFLQSREYSLIQALRSVPRHEVRLTHGTFDVPKDFVQAVNAHRYGLNTINAAYASGNKMTGIFSQEKLAILVAFGDKDEELFFFPDKQPYVTFGDFVIKYKNEEPTIDDNFHFVVKAKWKRGGDTFWKERNVGGTPLTASYTSPEITYISVTEPVTRREWMLACTGKELSAIAAGDKLPEAVYTKLHLVNIEHNIEGPVGFGRL